MKKSRHVRNIITTVITIALFAFIASCGGGGDDGGAAGASATITLEVSATSIPADGSSSVTIKATVKDSAGNPVRHYTDVTFSTDLGHFINGSKRYTMQTQPPIVDGRPDIKAAPTGVAEVQFIAETTGGSAKVTVTSNGVTNSVYISLTGGVGAIVLSASPESIPADGTSAYTVKATVTDSLGGAVTPGTEITFKTGLGHFRNGSKTYTVKTTDATGVVDVSVIAGVVPGTTYVQATSSSVTQALSVVMTKTDPLYSEITVEANPSRIEANGKSQSLITATVTQIQNITNAQANAADKPISGVPITLYKITSNVVSEPLPEANLYTGTGTSIKGPFYSYGGLIEFTMTAIPGTDSNPYFILWLFNPLSGKRELLSDFGTFPCETWVDLWHCETITKKVSKSPLPGNYQMEIQTNCSFEIKVDGNIGPAQTGKTVLDFGKTDANGKAFYTYTADWLPGTFEIKAETGELSNSEQALSEETKLTQTQGTPAPIEIIVPKIDLYANGTNEMTITALVWTPEGNIVPDGTVVNFSASIGKIEPAASVTVAGIASATLTAIASATSVVSTITATVGTDSNTATVTFIGAALADMSATPSVLVADGVTPSTINVYLIDPDGVGVNGETVTFTTTGGTLENSQAVTDTKGLASTTLISASTSGAATVTASYGAQTTNTTVTFSGGGGAVASITVTATPSTLPANGTSTSNIRAQVKNIQGDPVTDGAVISFTITSGTGTLSGTTATTVGGYAVLTYTAGNIAGSVVIQATAANFVSGNTTLTLTSGGVGSITLTASPTSIPADGSSSSAITATVKDASGNPVPAGTTVNFTTTLGTLSSASVTTADDTGIVTVSLIAGTTAGAATVTATSNSVTQSVTVILGGGVGYITLVASPTSIPADGSSSSAITATVKDASGNPVPAGTTVNFTTTLGTLSSATVITADATGTVTVSLIASTTAGTATVVCSSSGVTQNVTVQFTGGAGTPASLSLGVSQTSVKSDNSDTSTVTATVLDANKAALEGILVAFSANGGQISASSGTTDANGQTTITFSSGTTDRSNQTVTITATVSGLAPELIPIQIAGSTLEITAGETNLTVGNTTTLTVTAKDAGGNLVFGAPITITPSGPEVTVAPATGTTLVNGQFSTTVTAATDGSVTVTAVWSAAPQASQAFTVGTTGNVFEILLPPGDPFTAKTRTTATLVTNSAIAVTFNDNGAAADTITSAALFGGFAAGDVIMVGGSTNNDGVYTLSSTVAPTNSTLTLVASDSLTTEGPTTIENITNGVLFRVRAPTPIANVVFATSIGVWDGGGSPIVTKAVNAQYASAVLTAAVAGSATVQAYDADDSSTTALKTVAFSIPSGDAAQITLQSNVYSVAPSIGGITNTATLTATVRTTVAAGGQVVSGAVVAFSLENTTGGGETVSPVVEITDGAGQAKSTFQSGSLSSGAEGVTVRAVVDLAEQTASTLVVNFAVGPPATITRTDAGSFLADGFANGDQISIKGSTSNDGYYTINTIDGTGKIITLVNADTLTAEAAAATVTITHVITDTIAIIIGGTAASVVIGRGTVIYDVDDATYRLPMSALVTDSNGNAVSGAVVTLSAWPLQYASGVWYDQDPDPNVEFNVIYYTGAFIDNEDANENLILDPGEDKDGNGQLTPASSSAGGVPIPSEVTTGANGVAAFDLIYLKASAVWIRTRVRARTFVVGTETTSSLALLLPAERLQAQTGLLPDSPFPVGLVTSTTVAVDYTFPTFLGATDVFTTSGNLSAGTSAVAAYVYTYTPNAGTPAAVGNWVWDFITVINTTAGVGAYFPVRIIIE